MAILDRTTERILAEIVPNGFKQTGAFNLRHNGTALCHGDSEHVKIKKKKDGTGIDVYIDSSAKGETVMIPVVVDSSGLADKVYNDFHIGAGADVTIIAGCGIHNSGCNESRHDGIHSFYIGKGASVRYEENHYGEGEGTGANVLNPVTNVYMEEDSVFDLETVQIRGVDSTNRETYIEVGAGGKVTAIERLMTHDEQFANSVMEVKLLGDGSAAQIASRSVAKDNSRQVFYPSAVGSAKCTAHVQCDAILMGTAQVRAIPSVDAQHVDAAIIHEAAIGRINDEQLLKLRTLGMNEEEAESVIVEAFLN